MTPGKTDWPMGLEKEWKESKAANACRKILPKLQKGNE